MRELGHCPGRGSHIEVKARLRRIRDIQNVIVVDASDKD